MATTSRQTGHDVMRALREAVEGTRWRDVMTWIQDPDCSDEQRLWAVQETLSHAPGLYVQHIIDDILNIVTDDQLGSVLTSLVQRGLWDSVSHVLRRNVTSRAQRRWIVEEASRHEGLSTDFSLHVLPHCQEREEMELAMTHLVSQGRWWSVGRVLKRGVSSAQHQWAVEEALTHAEPWQFVSCLLPHCTDRQLEQVLQHMVSQGVWKPVDSTIHGHLSVTEHVLNQVVSLRNWTTVGSLLQRNISQAQHWWAVEQASKHADHFNFLNYILPRCRDELEHTITNLVSRGLWRLVDTVLQRGKTSIVQRQWAVESAMKQAQEADFTNCILHHCTEEQLTQALACMESRGVWEHDDSADCILRHCTQQQLEHVLACMESQDVWEPAQFLRLSDISITQRILSEMMFRHRWEAVGRFLQRDISHEVHAWAVKQAMKDADIGRFVVHILPHCCDEELEYVITYLVSKNQWKAVGEVLGRGVSSTQLGWVLEQASRHADEALFIRFILPQCRDRDLQGVTTHLVSQGLWQSVGKVLERGVCVTQHRWAVEQASQCAGDRDFVCYMLPQCKEEDLQHVIPHLVSRGQWWSADKVLERGVGPTLHRWAVEEALKHASGGEFAEHLLHHCSGEDLEQVSTHRVSQGLWEPAGDNVTTRQHVLSQIVSQGQWKAVGRFLERELSGAEHKWAIDQSSRHAGDSDFVRCILPQCHDQELEDVSSHLVSRGLWKSVVKVLERSISSIQHAWIVEEALKDTNNDDFVSSILSQCHDEELEQVITHLVSRGLWGSVGLVLDRGICTDQHRWAVLEAARLADDDSFLHAIVHVCSVGDTVAAFPLLVATRKWRCVQYVFCDVIRDALSSWMTPRRDSRARDTLFWEFMQNCHVDMSLALDLTKTVTQRRDDMNYDDDTNSSEHSFYANSSLAERISWNYSYTSFVFADSVKCQKALSELLVASLSRTLCCVICNDDRWYTDSTEHTKQCVSDIYSHIIACIKDNTDCIHNKTLTTIQNKRHWTTVFTEIADTHKGDALFLLHFLQGLHLYHMNRRGKDDDAVLLVMLAVLPLFPQLQSEALRMMVGEQRWDVISQACLTHLWEHDQRWLFKSAVEEKQWRIVLQWADHTVHDDQRDWAMKEALKEKQWEVYLLLADHGLTMQEHMHANYMVAKYGDWNTVLKMVERGGDITEVSNLLENWVTRNLRLKPQGDPTVYFERCKKLIRLRLRFARNSALSPMKVLDRCMWGSVLFNILHKPTEEYFTQVLHKVIEEQEWHILMHLVRLGMNVAERHWLFPQMVRQQQWGVCRKLIEIGVDVQLCLEALPELMERNQWTLVARVMELEVDDAVRCQVMQYAFQMRAGVLFWHCLSSMRDKEHLPMETQEKLFHQAISQEIWQAVKPLVEQKDSAGIQRRDLAFLEAIEQHLWDVVDYCQPLGADINMEDENGETPLHREARKTEWKAIEEIVFRDGKPNLLDKDGVSVLNRLLYYGQWDTAKFVIKYGGNIHLPAKYREDGKDTPTPMQAMIEVRQVDIIHFTVMWCPEQRKGVNERGETALHAACDSDRWGVMEDLVMRRVDPLAVTETGQTALVYAVLNTQCPDRMVAECSRLGFTIYQPSVTGPQESLLDNLIDTVRCMQWRFYDHWIRHHIRQNLITSPLVCAVLCDLPLLAVMLYEAGSCSNAELVWLCSQLPKLNDPHTEEGWKLRLELHRHIEDGYRILGTEFRDRCVWHYSRLAHIFERNVAFLRQLTTAPRTLLSSCRLLILHHFHAQDKTRQERLNQLPLPVPLKNYLQFSDLRDPDFGGKLRGIASDDTDHDHLTLQDVF